MEEEGREEGWDDRGCLNALSHTEGPCRRQPGGCVLCVVAVSRCMCSGGRRVGGVCLGSDQPPTLETTAHLDLHRSNFVLCVLMCVCNNCEFYIVYGCFCV